MSGPTGSSERACEAIYECTARCDEWPSPCYTAFRRWQRQGEAS